MKLNRIHLIRLLSIGTIMISVGCGGFQKFAADKIVVAALKNKRSDIVEAAKFSIGATYDNTIRYFPASGVNDSAMRKKIESLGSDVYVKYQKENDPVALPDSTVVFTSFHDVGTVEVIFDFATFERDIRAIVPTQKNTQITKVAERTYYRRSPEPFN